MKTFVVTAVEMVIKHDNGSMSRIVGAQRTVEADYYRVVDGALVFRTEKRGNEQYNPAVRTFAPGFWAEVHEKKTLQERLAEAGKQPAFNHHAREVDLDDDYRPFQND